MGRLNTHLFLLLFAGCLFFLLPVPFRVHALQRVQQRVRALSDRAGLFQKIGSSFHQLPGGIL